MGIRMVFQCDRCKATNDDTNEVRLHEVGFGVKQLTYSPTGSYYQFSDQQTRHAQWCEKCCLEVGIMMSAKVNPEVKAEQLPSLEDMVREIARETANQEINRRAG